MNAPPEKPLDRAVKPAKQAARRHYGSHPYFTKRAWNVVQEYIRHFSAPGATVLDPFGGSGVTAVETLVLRRKAVNVDVSDWACFLARQTALAPVDIDGLRQAFADVECRCRSYLEQLWEKPAGDLEKVPVTDWYPRSVPLPGNADAGLVEHLFTVRMLYGLARLRACIMDVAEEQSRDLLRMAFSATLARINRTFLSTTNRKESRGGSAIFSLYRYKVAARPVELPLWEQFATRVRRLLQAKAETNELIGDYYREGDTAIFRHGSATRILDWIKPGSIDYIYTDPPYGGHIAYLDLSTMWAAWLGLDITAQDRDDEVIEGGDRHKTSSDYHRLLSLALQQMHEVLRSGAWLSVVFAHRDTSYWESLVDASRAAGFDYVNTVTQPVGVVWSVHKKKNPLRVLSGELVLNFRKGARVVPRSAAPPEQDPVCILRECCETAIVRDFGATTETAHHLVVPRLLETGQLARFSREHGDITPLLQEFYDFDQETGRWHLREDGSMVARVPKNDLARYHVLRLLSRRARQGKPATEIEVQGHIRTVMSNGQDISEDKLRSILKQLAYTPDQRHWLPIVKEQPELCFTDEEE
jgi:16S rRNA G966 N2-methylase RsmD